MVKSAGVEANLSWERTLWKPERDKIYTVWKEGRAAVDEFAELGHSLNKMRVDEVSNPLWRLLTVLCLQLDFKYPVPASQRQFCAETSKDVWYLKSSLSSG
jgi:hypothetical protein